MAKCGYCRSEFHQYQVVDGLEVCPRCKRAKDTDELVMQCKECKRPFRGLLMVDYCPDCEPKSVINSLEPHPFRVITAEMFNLYRKKNHDYGDSFAEQFRELGMASSIIRLSDKLSRLKTLHTKEGKVSDESIRDTLIDLANYAVMTLMELDKAKEAEK